MTVWEPLYIKPDNPRACWTCRQHARMLRAEFHPDRFPTMHAMATEVSAIVNSRTGAMMANDG